MRCSSRSKSRICRSIRLTGLTVLLIICILQVLLCRLSFGTWDTIGYVYAEKYDYYFESGERKCKFTVNSSSTTEEFFQKIRIAAWPETLIECYVTSNNYLQCVGYLTRDQTKNLSHFLGTAHYQLRELQFCSPPFSNR